MILLYHNFVPKQPCHTQFFLLINIQKQTRAVSQSTTCISKQKAPASRCFLLIRSIKRQAEILGGGVFFIQWEVHREGFIAVGQTEDSFGASK